MKKYPILILFLATCLIVLPSFQKKEEDQLKIIERGVEIKVEQFRLRKVRDCKEKALKRAIVVADSLMTIEALFMKIDTTNKPPRPKRPQRPINEIPTKPIVVKPLLDTIPQ